MAVYRNEAMARWRTTVGQWVGARGELPGDIGSTTSAHRGDKSSQGSRDCTEPVHSCLATRQLLLQDGMACTRGRMWGSRPAGTHVRTLVDRCSGFHAAYRVQPLAYQPERSENPHLNLRAQRETTAIMLACSTEEGIGWLVKVTTSTNDTILNKSPCSRSSCNQAVG